MKYLLCTLALLMACGNLCAIENSEWTEIWVHKNATDNPKATHVSSVYLSDESAIFLAEQGNVTHLRLTNCLSKRLTPRETQLTDKGWDALAKLKNL